MFTLKKNPALFTLFFVCCSQFQIFVWANRGQCMVVLHSPHHIVDCQSCCLLNHRTVCSNADQWRRRSGQSVGRFCTAPIFSRIVAGQLLCGLRDWPRDRKVAGSIPDSNTNHDFLTNSYQKAIGTFNAHVSLSPDPQAVINGYHSGFIAKLVWGETCVRIMQYADWLKCLLKMCTKNGLYASWNVLQLSGRRNV